jgi:hypothetical protein
MKHKHADLMMQYAQDAQTTENPWELWECRVPTRSIGKNTAPEWGDCISGPAWAVAYEYRRKPQTHTVTLNTEQLKEIILACECPSWESWENGDFVTGVQVLQNALGVQPKTNAQIVCEKLRKAYDDLEKHSAEIVEPNVDHIQKLVWDAMKLLTKGDVK